ncbi:hypothetical protein [Elizabethkingia ursingii]|uniref:Uncharacterized protein n=1 Tax=Elizabethkingia ursingii TaxID=1756150 RepID=A0AAJ3N9T2_9FLAO|nr:hypothetical protein [Elizabethkingia ursingii]AQX08381.1 hypothetical protein BBD34_06865 [Elizabethkingia ursingii]OPB72153.1 hypothetical protein BAY32_13495 [Elizabethkingia ursingii]
MKDIHVYNDKIYKGNLLSIRSSYKHLNQIEFLLEEIFPILHNQLPGCLFIECSRPTYEYDLSDLSTEIKSSIEDKDIYFFFSKSENHYSDNDFKNNEILNILPKLWLAFEYLCFRFTNVKNNNINDYYRRPWYEITSVIESYIVFKGIEEDVIWIGKSDNLEFKEILEI